MGSLCAAPIGQFVRGGWQAGRGLDAKGMRGTMRLIIEPNAHCRARCSNSALIADEQ